MSESYDAIVWIDDHDARVVRLYGHGVDYRRVVPPASQAVSGAPAASAEAVAYYVAVLDALGDAERFLLTGPTVTKAAFAHWLETRLPWSATRVAGFATLPRMPDNRLVEAAGRLFADKPIHRRGKAGAACDRCIEDDELIDGNPCDRCEGPADVLTLDCFACTALDAGQDAPRTAV